MTKRKIAPKSRPLKKIPHTPVSEIAPEEQIVGALFLGKLRSFDPRAGLASLRLESALAAGDTIRVKGLTTDLTQKVERIEIRGLSVPNAEPGETVNLFLADRVKVGDAVYKL